MPSTRLFGILALCLLCVPVNAGDLTTGLVGHWCFERSDGKSVKDVSTGGHDGLIALGKLQKEKGEISIIKDGDKVVE